MSSKLPKSPIPEMSTNEWYEAVNNILNNSPVKEWSTKPATKYGEYWSVDEYALTKEQSALTLIGQIIQIEIVHDRVYIVQHIGRDSQCWYRSCFDKSGKKLGPGQYYPHSYGVTAVLSEHKKDINNYNSIYLGKTFNDLDKFIQETNTKVKVPGYICPLCKGNMEERKGRYGLFYSCLNWKKTSCPGTLNADGTPSKKTKSLMKLVPPSSIGPPKITIPDDIANRFNIVDFKKDK